MTKIVMGVKFEREWGWLDIFLSLDCTPLGTLEVYDGIFDPC